MAAHDNTAESPQDGAVAPPRPAQSDAGDAPSKQSSMRSWRKKYRKMRARFDDGMRESNSLFREERKATFIVHRLQEQTDELLDLLLDINDAPEIPPQLRFDLSLPSHFAVMLSDTDAVRDMLRVPCEDLAAKHLQSDGYDHGNAIVATKMPAPGGKSLSKLLKVPHTCLPLDLDKLPQCLDGSSDGLLGYFSPRHEEEYLKGMDVALTDPNAYDHTDIAGRPVRNIPSDKELQIRNPDSVYNWLRKHQPQVFLQDKENDKTGDGPEKATRTGGNGRGGRRGHTGTATGAASVLAATIPMRTDPDEDDTFVPDTGNGRGKRTRDDEAYRPKGGGSRLNKRKRDDSENGTRAARRKGSQR